jgi:hypothetical protein
VRSIDVTACLVTRGDQPAMMARIRESLVFDRVVVWDNSRFPDWKCAGRYMAMTLAETDWCFFQDDDVIVPEGTQRALLGAADDVDDIVANWGHGENPDGYDDLPLVCGGAVARKSSAWQAIAEYGAAYPLDQEFMYEADFAVGVLYPSFGHVWLPFEINLEVAQHPSRLVNQPWQKATKLKITERARAIRDSR